MTAAVSSPMPSLAGGDVCRVTVSAPHGRVDLAVPVSTTMAVLLPVLLRHLPAKKGEQPGRSWLLQRLGEKPFAPDETPQSLGLRDGDVLYLRPADDPLPVLEFDDIADGVAHAVNARTDRWRPELTGRLLLGLAYLVLAVLAFALLNPSLGAATGVCAAVAAAVLAVCSAVETIGRSNTHVLGSGACVFAALTGMTALRGAAGVFTPRSADVLLAAVGALVMTGVLFATRRVPLAVLVTVLVSAVAGGLGAGLAILFGLSATGSAALVAVLLFLPAHWWPRLSLRLARVRVSPLPRNAEELQQDIDPEPEEHVSRRVAVADSCLTGLTVSSSLVALVAAVLLVRWTDWSGVTLTAMLAGVQLSQARSQAEIWQRTSCVVGGTIGLLLVVLALAPMLGATGQVAFLFVLLAAGGLLLVGARRLPRARLLPVWGNLADILEIALPVALLPVLLQVLDVYMYFRASAG
ncbi:MAG TPA: type VII secretion integral membrane protein EccD [Amycolatopsis sp.]|nr:type VII secretion integral membrane protein EccD [Amycolatopsis sp.]